MTSDKWKQSEEAVAAADRLWEHAAGLGRGDMIAHEVIEQIVGAPRHDPVWRSATAAFRRRMLDQRDIVLNGVAAGGCGLKLLTVSEQVGWLFHHRSRKARRQYQWIERDVSAVPVSEMTAYQRRLAAAHVESAQSIRRAIKADARARAVLFAPAQPLPRASHVHSAALASRPMC